jgi:hypothetical protein
VQPEAEPLGLLAVGELVGHHGDDQLRPAQSNKGG